MFKNIECKFPPEWSEIRLFLANEVLAAAKLQCLYLEK